MFKKNKRFAFAFITMTTAVLASSMPKVAVAWDADDTATSAGAAGFAGGLSAAVAAGIHQKTADYAVEKEQSKVNTLRSETPLARKRVLNMLQLVKDKETHDRWMPRIDATLETIRTNEAILPEHEKMLRLLKKRASRTTKGFYASMAISMTGGLTFIVDQESEIDGKHPLVGLSDRREKSLRPIAPASAESATPGSTGAGSLN